MEGTGRLSAVRRVSRRDNLPTPFRQKRSSDQRYMEDTMKFRPLHDRVVVKRIDAEAKSAGGIIIPDTAQEKPSHGEFVAVGPGGPAESAKPIPPHANIDDPALFA